MILLKTDVFKAAIPAENKRLRALLNAREPKTVRILARLWQKQGRDLTYQEIRRMLETGDLTPSMLERWRQDYSDFVIKHLMPQWKSLIKEAGRGLGQRLPGFHSDPAWEGISQYTAAHAAELVTNSTSQQIEALRALVQHASLSKDITVDELSRLVRPVVGLYREQVTANFNYYTARKKELLKKNPSKRVSTAEKRARDAAIKFAEKQHRYRAMMIARTELAFGYNAGEYLAIKQAQSEMLMGTVIKKWSSSGDSRMCDYCRAVHGEEVPLDSEFSCGVFLPPLHPHCRCGVQYIETGERPRAAFEPQAVPLNSRSERGIMSPERPQGLSSGRPPSEENPYTHLDLEEDFDFSDQQAIRREIESFARRYAYAQEEHTLVLSPLGKKYELTGISGVVDPSIVGAEALKGSIGMHNHPVPPGEDMDDSFSVEDLMICSEFQTDREYLVSGRRKNLVVFEKHYSKTEIYDAYEKCKYLVWQRADEQELDFSYFLQEEIMRIISTELEGIKFYEL